MSWKTDLAHSQIQFSVRHMMISNVRGRFENFEATVNFNEKDPAASTVEAKIDAASINTRDANRDGHLKSPDFFDVEKYPYITFRSKKVVVLDDNHAKIYGDMTIRDITREVVLNTEYSGQAKAPWGTTSAGFTATTKINRKDWGLTWNKALETGGMLVGDDINIEIDLEVVKQPEAEEELAGMAAD